MQPRTPQMGSPRMRTAPPCSENFPEHGLVGVPNVQHEVGRAQVRVPALPRTGTWAPFSASREESGLVIAPSPRAVSGAG